MHSSYEEYQNDSGKKFFGEDNIVDCNEEVAKKTSSGNKLFCCFGFAIAAAILLVMVIMLAIIEPRNGFGASDHTPGPGGRRQPIDFEITAPILVRGLTKCEICEAGIAVIQSLLALNKSESEVAKGITDFCIRLRIEDKKICIGIVRTYKIEVLTVLDRLALSPRILCGVIRLCSAARNPFPMWNVTLPNVPKPAVIHYPESTDTPLRVLQISDLHLDFDYAEGSEADCSEPVCCRKTGVSNATVKTKAGRWGMYGKCDTPVSLLNNLLDRLAQEKFDYIIWTGDTPGHNVWNQTQQVQLDTLSYITRALSSRFPDTRIFPALGNHESSPVNSFPQPFIKGQGSISWLYDALATHWQSLGLSNSTTDNITRGAFYTELVRPGFRIISLNMNYCNSLNWWLLLNTTDPAGELQWLVDTLQRAETSKEKVHIIGHIPSGQDDCMKAWSWNYYRVINRYESTIVAQFFGHTHFDSVQIFYADGDDHRNEVTTNRRATSVAYVSPSVTTYGNLNPGYRTYSVDSQYYNIIDHTTYIMNLTAANEGHPEWTEEYSAKKSYEMNNLSPESWNYLIKNFESNDTLAQLFYKHYWKSHPIEKYCDKKCVQLYICELITSRSHDPEICKSLKLITYEGFTAHRLEKKYC